MRISEMENVDITKVKADELVDIREVHVNKRLQPQNRIADFVRQIQNPYCYKCGDYIVKISFENSSATLTDKLREIITQNAGMV